jgi:hypothetical protein
MILHKLTNGMCGNFFFIVVQLCSNNELKVVNFYQWNFCKQYHVLFQKINYNLLLTYASYTWLFLLFNMLYNIWYDFAYLLDDVISLKSWLDLHAIIISGFALFNKQFALIMWSKFIFLIKMCFIRKWSRRSMLTKPCWNIIDIFVACMIVHITITNVYWFVNILFKKIHWNFLYSDLKVL